MKKILLLAVIMMATAVCGATPDKKEKKKKKDATEQKVEPIKLLSASDSLSYAAGMTATRGLIAYLQQQYGVDTAYIKDFIEGYKEATNKFDDPKYVARNAGTQIARMVDKRIQPSNEKQFKST